MRNIIVCVKQVPDVQTPLAYERGAGPDFSKIQSITNPCDLSAVEWSIRVKEKSREEVRVTAVSLGSEKAEAALRECLAMGVDRVLILNDKNTRPLDGYCIGTMISVVIQRDLIYDIIVCGAQSADNNAGWVGAVIASQLNLPLITRVTQIEINDQFKGALIKRKLEAGKRQIVEAPLPCVITVGTELGKPRYPKLRDILAARKQKIDHCDLDDIQINRPDNKPIANKVALVKLSVSKPRPKKLFTPDSSLSPMQRMKSIISGGIQKSSGSILEGNTQQITAKFIDFLANKKFIKGK